MKGAMQVKAMQDRLFAGLTGSELRDYQQARIMEICRHAASNSAFYTERLNHILRTSKFSLEAWRQVRPLTRRDLITHKSEIRCAVPVKDAGPIREVFTSGTSGAPMSFEVNRLSDVFSQVGYRRYFQAWGIGQARRILTVRPAKNETDRNRVGLQRAVLPGGMGEEFTSFSLEANQTLKFIEEIKPNYLRTFPSLAFEAAQRASARNMALKLDLVMTVGETVMTEHQSAVREAFQCEIADAYAAEEVGLIGFNCPKCGNFHTTSENLIVELLDTQGANVAVGQEGRVVLTTLNNFSMPLIRYELEDWAVRGHASGDCGNRGFLISRVLGRRRNMFLLQDGRSIWPSIPSSRLYGLGVDLFRFVQRDRSTVELIYISAHPEKFDAGELQELVHEFLDRSLTVSATRVDDLRAGGRGKVSNYESFAT